MYSDLNTERKKENTKGNSNWKPDQKQTINSN